MTMNHAPPELAGARMVMRCDRLGCDQVVDVDVHAPGMVEHGQVEHLAFVTLDLARRLGWTYDGASTGLTFCPACSELRAATRAPRSPAP